MRPEPAPLRLPPGTAAGPEVLEAVHELLEQTWTAHPDVSVADRMCVETALIELVANIVEHAGGAAELAVEVEVHPERVQAVFRDTGSEFAGDLDSATMPDDMSERGRGLALIRALLDEVTYGRVAGANCWHLVRFRT